MRRSMEALAASLLVAALACGGGGDEADTGGDVAVEEEAAPAVSPDSAATITGVVNFTGSAPAGEPIDMSEETGLRGAAHRAAHEDAGRSPPTGSWPTSSCT